MKNLHHTIAEQIGNWLGISIGPSHYASMMRSMTRVANELGWADDPHIWAARLSRKPDPETMLVLAKFVTIGETYFFREQPSVDFISQIIVPEVRKHIEQATHPYKIWSAACSTGEEPYSVVMQLLNEMPGLKPENLEVLATDVNPEAIAKARMGLYREWSFRATPAGLRNQFFRREAKDWAIADQVRNFVKFQLHNLISDPYPEGYNLILCRNVFIYFEPPTIKAIAQRFNICLKPGGWLVTSQVELNDELYESFVRIAQNQGFFYRKPLTDEKKQAVTPTKPRAIKEKKIEDVGLSPSGSKRTVRTETSLLRPAAELEVGKIEPSDELKSKTQARAADELKPNVAHHTIIHQDHSKALQPESSYETSSFFHEALQAIEQHRPEHATQLLQHTLYLEPGHHEARFQYAHLLSTLNQHNESARQYRILLRQLQKMQANDLVFGGLSADALIALCNLALEHHE